MLAETIVVTSFVVGVLIFLFIQFTNLTKNYNDHYEYNTVEGLYALKNVRNYIKSDDVAFNAIKDKVTESNFLDIKNCDIFSEKEYCLKLFELNEIDKIYVTNNDFKSDIFDDFDESFKKFIEKINAEGDENYRLLVEFNDKTFATIRVGE